MPRDSIAYNHQNLQVRKIAPAFLILQAVSISTPEKVEDIDESNFRRKALCLSRTSSRRMFHAPKSMGRRQRAPVTASWLRSPGLYERRLCLVHGTTGLCGHS